MHLLSLKFGFFSGEELYGRATETAYHVGKIEFSMQRHMHPQETAWAHVHHVEEIESPTRNRRQNTKQTPNRTQPTSRHVAPQKTPHPIKRKNNPGTTITTKNT